MKARHITQAQPLEASAPAPQIHLRPNFIITVRSPGSVASMWSKTIKGMQADSRGPKASSYSLCLSHLPLVGHLLQISRPEKLAKLSTSCCVLLLNYEYCRPSAMYGRNNKKEARLLVKCKHGLGSSIIILWYEHYKRHTLYLPFIDWSLTSTHNPS